MVCAYAAESVSSSLIQLRMCRSSLLLSH